MRSNRILALAVAASLLTAAGCTDDNDTISDPTEDSATSEERRESSASIGARDFCESYLAADALVGPAMTAGGAGSAEVVAAFQGLPDPPSELEASLKVMIEQVDAMFGEAAGGPSDDEFDVAAGQVTDWVIDNCGLEAWDIVADDYAFEAAEALPLGSYVITLDNQGTEFHEAQVIQINPGEEAPLEALLQLPEEELLSKVTPLSAAFASPGESGQQIITFIEPGRYGIVCLLPIGSTFEAMESGSEPTGAPHFTEGMFAEFTVGP